MPRPLESVPNHCPPVLLPHYGRVFVQITRRSYALAAVSYQPIHTLAWPRKGEPGGVGRLGD